MNYLFYNACFIICSLKTFSSSYELIVLIHYENMPMKYTEMFFFFKCKNLKFHWKDFEIFNIYAQNIDCEYPQSIFWNKNKKNSIPPCTPVLLYKSVV